MYSLRIANTGRLGHEGITKESLVSEHFSLFALIKYKYECYVDKNFL